MTKKQPKKKRKQPSARVLDERRTMLGCMAGKGYKMVAGGQDVTGVPTFPVGEAP
jgi:hypothetical protein